VNFPILPCHGAPRIPKFGFGDPTSWLSTKKAEVAISVGDHEIPRMVNLNMDNMVADQLKKR
jgi:hypothetical protein